MAYSSILKPTDYFNTKLYTGTGATNAITGVGFQPDFTWIKNRNVTTYDHRAFDVVRGANKKIKPNTTEAETTTTQELSSFDLDGFSLGTENGVNASSTNFASWSWKAGGTASSNTDGSITSSVSANTTSGFSIVSYTGTGSTATVGHGLGSTPKMMILRNLSEVKNWVVYHHILGNAQALKLNTTDASASGLSNFNSTSPTSSVFTVGDSSNTNSSGQNMIAYCFAEKQGYSKFGSYVGNGSTDGTFVYTGFKPAFVILKASSAAGQNWMMFDNKRNEFNVMNKKLYADNALAEETSDYLDFTSNGYKLKTTSSDGNGSGTTYIYMAFAENPFVASNFNAATAR